MKYGCIGENLKHSFSKEIHYMLGSYDYELREIKKDSLDSFMIDRDFLAINVTIPYKERVIPHLYYIDEHAHLIGAVNTVVNRAGKLYGYNTDFFGLLKLIEHAQISVKGKNVAILGTGGTSKTALSVCEYLGAKNIVRASRSGKEGAISYSLLYEEHKDTEIIINTTPVGMFPNCSDAPIDINLFPSLSGVIDAVYNPLRTTLISSAKQKGIAAEGGLYMLVAQAVRASEIFLDTEYEKSVIDEVYKKVSRKKENIVLIGMPSSGKSTVGNIISSACGRRFVDTDGIIEKNGGITITEIFKAHGEAKFRDIESEAVKEAASGTGLVLATGGGTVLREENVKALKQNGILYFIDRPLEKLMPTEDRPLSSSREAIEKRYKERYPIYKRTADVIIDADCEANEVAEKILSAHSNF